MKQASRVVGWPEGNVPSAAQLKEFFDQVAGGRISLERLRKFLNMSPTRSFFEIFIVLFQRIESVGEERMTSDMLQSFLEKSPSLLERVGVVIVPALEASTGLPNNVKVSYIGDNFSRLFANKLAAAVPTETEIAYATLRKNSLDGPIIGELGEAAKTTIGVFRWFLGQQPDGRSGDLLVDGKANIFYIEDDEGALWAVGARWGGGGWGLGADPASYPGEWVAGRQVFSRNLV